MKGKDSLYHLIIVGFVAFLYFIPYQGLSNNFKRVPIDRYYFGSVDFAIDMLGNLATVRQGYLGHWQRMPRETVLLDGKPTFLKFEYIAIGQLARFFHWDPVTMYYVVRAVLSVVTVIFILRLLYHLVSHPIYQIIGTFFIFFGTGITEFWKTYPYRVMDVMPGDTLVFQRLTTAAPHYLLGIFLPLISVYCLSQFIDRKKFTYFVVSIISGMLTAFVFSPSLLLVLGSLPFVFIRKRALRGAIIMYAVLSILPVLYIRYVSQYWDFNVLTKTEFVVPFRLIPTDYLFAVGFSYLFALIGVRSLFETKKTLFLLIAPWIVIHPVAALVLSWAIHINPSRFFFGPYFVAFGILAALGIRQIQSFVARKTSTGVAYVVVLMLLIGTLVSSFYSYGASLQNTTVCFCNVQFGDYGYPKKNLMNAIFWLRDHTKESDVVLSGPYAGVLIPAFSGNKVYTSYWLRFMDEITFTKTDTLLSQFYSGSMTVSQAFKHLKDTDVHFILFGDQERQYSAQNDLHYPFLHRVAVFGDTSVFEVNLSGVSSTAL